MDEKELQPMDPIVSALFDMDLRVNCIRDNMATAEKLINGLREKMKNNSLKEEDARELESLLFVSKEFFEVVSDDLVTDLLVAIDEKNNKINDGKDSQNNTN